jgi:hypothetical protein
MRQKKAETRQKVFLNGSRDRSPRNNVPLSGSVRVDSVLATIRGPGDNDRLQIISEGLRNLEEGFPSDHLPVGALFVGHQEKKTSMQLFSAEGSSTISQFSSETKSGISSSVQRKREAHCTSVGLRRRHNAVLNAVSDWLMERGICNIVRDQPLYKNELLQSNFAAIQQQIKRKSRAPDLIGMVMHDKSNDVLVVVEVAVTSSPDKVRIQKLSKYQDLVSILGSNMEENDKSMKCHLFAVVVHENETIPDQTRNDLEQLAMLTEGGETLSPALQNEVDQFCDHLGYVMSSFLQ